MAPRDTTIPTAFGIGALARETGASVRSIRHYDAQGLLASTRAANGYRSFAPIAATQVRQIRRMIAAGLSLDEIRGFPDCMRMIDGAAICSETTEAQRERLVALEREIADLERRRERLRAMLDAGRVPLD